MLKVNMMTRTDKSILIFSIAAASFFVYSYLIKQPRLKEHMKENPVELREWTKNNLNGAEFIAPGTLQQEPLQLNQNSPQIQRMALYILKNNSLITMFTYLDTRFDQYDKEKGISQTISNTVKVMGGDHLTLKFTNRSSNPELLYAMGQYKLKDREIIINGCIHWDNKGKVRILTSMIPKNKDNKEINQKIVNSFKLVL